MQSTCQTGAANATSSVLSESSISDFYTNIAVWKYFVSFKLKSLKSNDFRQSINLSKH